MRVRRPPRPQRGFALVLVMLALVIMSAAALNWTEARVIELKAQAGRTEASVLEQLRDAANTAMHRFLLDIQAGAALTAASHTVQGATVTITPTVIGTGPSALRSWSPSVQNLVDLGYLPPGWAITRSSLNNAVYAIEWHQTACPGPGPCDVEGHVVLNGAIRGPSDAAGTSDGTVIAQILNHFGVTAGVSLHTNPATISGYGRAWSLPNPLGATPGVVAVRFGTHSSLMASFVRIGDSRDPALAGNLSATGNLSIGGSSALQGNLQVGPSGSPCVRIMASGQVFIDCDGRLQANTGTYTDGTPANVTTITPTGLTATGTVQGDQVTAARKLSGPRLALANVVEGQACVPEADSQYAGLAGGGLAYCASGRWAAMNRLRAAGSRCTPSEESAAATDPISHHSLICRNGIYWNTAALLSNLVLVETRQLNMAAGPVIVPKPVCASAAGGVSADARIILAANNESSAGDISGIVSGINRYADENRDGTWTVHLERSYDNVAMQGNVIASLYCWYHPPVSD